MRVPLELEHLIKTALSDAPPQPLSLAGRLDAIEARKALEVEHYLRVCALRLGLAKADGL